VPIDFSGHRSSGIAALAYARLRDYLDLPRKPIRVYDPVQQLAIVDEDVLQRFHVDTIELGRAFALEDKYWTDWVLPDGTPCLMPVWAKPEKESGEWVMRSRTERVIARMPPGVLYFEQAHFPLLENDDPTRIPEAFDECMWTALHTPPGPIVAGPDGQRALAEGAQRLSGASDRAILGLFGGNLLEIGQYFYRNDNFFMLLAGDPDRAHQFLDCLLQIHLANLDRFLDAVGEHIDVILFGDDFGMQNGPQISVAMYREFFKPRETIMWQRVRKRSRAKIMLHCCGGVRELLPDMIEAGLDAINPVQISCRGMNPAGLKADYGDRLTFWGGGCDTRQVLISGTPAQVRDHVRHQVADWQPDKGGYVFQQVHNIMADVPSANIVAMFDALNGA
jgi:uroporphyrinogen decarboxylase